jgi:hypothetical protein
MVRMIVMGLEIADEGLNACSIYILANLGLLNFGAIDFGTVIYPITPICI